MLSQMQRLENMRCIVSISVVYAKNADTHLGICIFAFIGKGTRKINPTCQWQVGGEV